jgi:hypothetical protein
MPGGVVTLSQIERNSPTTANAETRNFNDLVYRSIAKIRLVSLNVTTPLAKLGATLATIFDKPYPV